MNHLSCVSTEQLPTTDRLGRWAQCVSQYAGRLPPPVLLNEASIIEPFNQRRFRGKLEFGDLGDLRFCRMAASAHRYRRALRSEHSIDVGNWTLVLQESGISQFTQSGRSVSLSPGEFVLLDMNQALDVTSSRGCEQIIMPVGERSVGQARSGRLYHLACEGGLGRMLFNLLHDSVAHYNHLSERASRALGDSLLEVLDHAFEQVSSDHDFDVRGTSRLDLVRQCIEERLHDPELNAETVAAALGWSSRSLHRYFHDALGCTFSDYMWQQRLTRCAEQLQDPVHSNLSITDIAYQLGFSSSSHFSRSFKSSFGMSPRAYRQARSA